MGFEPWISGDGGDCCATTTALFYLIIFSWFVVFLDFHSKIVSGYFWKVIQSYLITMVVVIVVVVDVVVVIVVVSLSRHQLRANYSKSKNSDSSKFWPMTVPVSTNEGKNKALKNYELWSALWYWIPASSQLKKAIEKISIINLPSQLDWYYNLLSLIQIKGQSKKSRLDKVLVGFWAKLLHMLIMRGFILWVPVFLLFYFTYYKMSFLKFPNKSRTGLMRVYCIRPFCTAFALLSVLYF